MINVVSFRGIPARYRKHGPKSCLTKEKLSPGCIPVPVRFMVNVGPLVIYRQAHKEKLSAFKNAVKRSCISFRDETLTPTDETQISIIKYYYKAL